MRLVVNSQMFSMRWLVRSSALLLSALMLISCSQDAQESVASANATGQQEVEYEWKMITAWPRNLPALGTNPVYFAELVEQMSNGRMTIEVFGANELVSGLEVFDAVSQGVAELGNAASYYWQGKVPGAAFFASVPFGMTAKELNGWLEFGGGKELWQELYAPFNLIPVRSGNSGTQMFGWFNKEINSLADVQGLKMRIPGLGGEVMNRAGATTITMQASDVFTAMQTGALDATEFVSAYNDLAAGYHTVADYYYYPGWHEPGSALETLINKERFEALPSDLQAIILTAAEASNQRLLDEFTARNNEALRVLVEEHDVELRRLPDDVLIELRRLSDEVVAEMASTNAMTQRIYDSYRTFQEGVENYHSVAEEAFIEARKLTSD